MKHLIIIKETEDIREGRSKTLKVGTKFSCTDELAKQYLKKKLAKLDEPDIKPRKELKEVKDAEKYEQEYEHNDEQ